MKEKLNISRPEVGYLSKVRLFNSDRPKPVDRPKEYETLPEPPTSISSYPEAEDSLKKTRGGRIF
jgi:hypothetical protein